MATAPETGSRSSDQAKRLADYRKVPPKSQEWEVIAHCDDILNRARRRDYSWHGLWYLLAANVAGRQWATWNARERVLTDPRVDKREILLVFNLLFPTVLKEAAQLTIKNPNFAAVPTSNDERSVSQAKIESKLLKWHWNSNSMAEYAFNANVMKAIFGMCWHEPWFDTTQGRLKKRAWNGGLHEYEGAVDTICHLPFDVFHDADATVVDELSWVCTDRMQDIGRIELAYERGDEVIPEKPDAMEWLRLRLQHLSSHNYANIVRHDDSDRFPNHARLKKFNFYPTREWPLGREIHYAGQVVLYDGDWLHSYRTAGSKRKHALIPDYYWKPPGRLKGMGIVEHLLEPQWEYNKTRCQFTKIKNKSAKPKWLNPKGSGVRNAPDDEPNEMINYSLNPLNPNAKPEPVSPDIKTGVFAEHWNAAKDDFQWIGSSHEVSRGTTPPGVESGIAIERLQSADQLARGGVMVSGLDVLKKIATAWLGLYGEFGPDEVVTSLTGLNYQHEYHTYKRLNSRPDTSVDIIHDGNLPLLPGERLILMERMLGSGLVNFEEHPEHRNKMLRFLDNGEAEELFHELDVDIRQAKRENESMLHTGTIPEVKPEDDHRLHIMQHTEAIKSYRELHPIRQAQLRVHIAAHLEFIGAEHRQTADAMGTMMEAQAGGAQPGPGRVEMAARYQDPEEAKEDGPLPGGSGPKPPEESGPGPSAAGAANSSQGAAARSSGKS